MQISWLPEPESHPLWPQIRALLKPAAELGQIDIYEPGDWVWIIFQDGTIHAAAVTRMLVGDEAELRLAAGHRLSEWIALLDETVSEWARDGGAYRLTMRGRTGWARFAERFGWQTIGRDDAGRMMFSKGL